MTKKTFSRSAICAAALSAALSCSTPKLTYFQDISEGSDVESVIPIKTTPITVKAHDKISIVVNSKDPELADLFNLPIISHRSGYGSGSGFSTSQQVSSYTIDSEGFIDIPILGKIHIAGLTREEISEKIKHELISENLVKDPIVTVEFSNLTISVLGEVTRPGQYAINRDNLTVLDAIGMAGDLTINGERENVLVIRRNGDKTNTYKLDLRSLDKVITSPGYVLQQDDVIYVTPNSKRQRESTVNGNNMRSTGFWISLSTLAITIVNLIMRAN